MKHCWEKFYLTDKSNLIDKCPTYLHHLLHMYQTTRMSRDDTDRNVRWSEEELSVEVGLLYGVHVCHNDLSLSSCQSNHGKVFQQLTANGTCSDLE